MASRGSTAITHGVRVDVHPAFDAARSNPATPAFVFTYRIRIANNSDRTVQLLSRRWLIVDADANEHVVEGEGVVGQQPVIEPGGSFDYVSSCPLQTPWGTMEGAYTMRAEDGETLAIRVERFYLVAETAPTVTDRRSTRA